eukprot:1175429-Prorocentrum_minimum.AAC.1
MVGETVTYTDKMQPGNGPGRRRNQVGYMKKNDKRQYARLRDLRNELKAITKLAPRDGEVGETPPPPHTQWNKVNGRVQADTKPVEKHGQGTGREVTEERWGGGPRLGPASEG